MSRVIHELDKRQQRIESCVSGILAEFSPLAIDFPLVDLTRNRRTRHSKPNNSDEPCDAVLISPIFYQFQSREWADITLRLA